MRKIMYVLLLTIMTGCGLNMGAGEVAEVIATEKTFPADFQEAGFYREEVPHFTYIVKKATEQGQYGNLWNYFGFQGEAPTVDFNENVVMFFSLEESGSCPIELTNEDIQTNPSAETLEIELPVIDSPCTADATPRTIVFTVAEEAGPFVEVVIIDREIETTVPIN